MSGYRPPPPNPNQVNQQHSSTPYGAPPSPYGSQSNQPPPSAAYGGSNVQHVSHVGPPPPSSGYNQTAVPYGSQSHQPPPSTPYGGSNVQHVSHVGPPPSPSQYNQTAAAYGSQSHQPPPSTPYGGSNVQHVSHVGPPLPSSEYNQTAVAAYGGQQQSPFSSLMPSVFPPGTDPSVVACFQLADKDRSGFIDDKELQGALSGYNQSFSLRTVHLLMYLFTNSNSRKIGPKEFLQVFQSLQSWRSIFERFDRDSSGLIDPSELREALLSLGFSVSPVVLDLLVLKFDKTGGRNRAIEYDNFIECCLTVKGLTEKFKAKDASYTGSATFAYEDFMLTVLPFLIA